jgi:dTDP-4-dehydrorhamnose 3,5-epimerase
MRFQALGLSGAWIIEPEPIRDRRGTFARTFCAREFALHGLDTAFVQHSTSQTLLRGTVRGMHFQLAPHAEVKVVTCTRGAVHDVIVDLRRESETYRQWRSVELCAGSLRQVYIPRGCAHGFQTLTDNADVAYLISSFYEPAASFGVRYDDPAFAVAWPLPIAALSERDASWPEYQD